MLHSVKYKIPAVIVMNRDEAIADRRRTVMENVLDSALPPDKKMRIYESTVARRLNEEEKLIDTPLLPSQDVVLAQPLQTPTQVIQKIDEIGDQDFLDNYNADIFNPPEEQTTVKLSPKSKSVKSASWHKVTPKRRTPKAENGDRRVTLPPAFAPDDRRATLSSLPSYMQPLNRKKKTDPSDASPATLRPNRPSIGHFKGKGRLSVVRW